MYFWTNKDLKITLIPTDNYNFKFIDKRIIKIMEKIIRNSDLVFFESNSINIDNEFIKEISTHPLHEFYNINVLKKILEKSFKINLSRDHLKDLGIFSLNHFNILTCNNEAICTLNTYLIDYSKKHNIKVDFFKKTNAKNIKLLKKMFEDNAKSNNQYMAKYPPPLNQIKQTIESLKKRISQYNNSFEQKCSMCPYTPFSHYTDRKYRLWAKKIKSASKKKSIAIVVDADSLNTSLDSNLIQILKDEYKIEFVREHIN